MFTRLFNCDWGKDGVCTRCTYVNASHPIHANHTCHASPDYEAAKQHALERANTPRDDKPQSPCIYRGQRIADANTSFVTTYECRSPNVPGSRCALVDHSGPGTELFAIFKSIGITTPAGCACRQLARQMNIWGPASCQEKRAEIVERIKANAGQWGLGELLSTIAVATVKSIFSGLAFTINPLDPIGSLIDEANRRSADDPSRFQLPVCKSCAFREPPHEIETKIRLAFITPCFYCGGVERWFLSLAKYLEPSKAAFTDIVIRSRDAINAEMVREIPQSIRVHYGGKAFAEATANADVCITWGCQDLPSIRKRIKCRVVDVQHGSLVGHPYQNGLVKAAMRSKAHLVAVSEPARQNFPEHVRPQVAVLANGVDLEHIKPIVGRAATRVKFGWTGKKIALYHGRIHPDKNPELLADAIAIMPGEWHAVMVGQNLAGETHSRNLIKRANGRLTIIPPQSRIGDFLAAADVCVITSDHESFCLSMVEAFAAGVQVVSTEHQALMWLESLHGVLCRSIPVRADASLLATSIGVDDDPKLEYHRGHREQIVERAQQIANEHYTASSMARRWEEYLKRIAP